MSIRVMEDKDGKVYVFDDFWDFVVLCIRVSPMYTFRAHVYATIGWMIGLSFGILTVELTWKWAATQALLLLFILGACSWITYFSLRKEWNYMRSANIVRRVPKAEPFSKEQIRDIAGSTDMRMNTSDKGRYE